MLAAGRQGRRARATAPAVALVVALAGCGGAPGAPVMPAAGAHDDDGVGQLAQASVQIRLGDGGPDFDAERERAEAAARRHYHDRSARSARSAFGLDPVYGGSVYGLDSSLGGGVYGGFGIGRTGFGIVGPALSTRGDAGGAAVLGVVTWRGDRGVAWPDGCPDARVARAGGATAGAVVFLANAPLRLDRFDDERGMISRGALDADRCALWPAAQVLGPVPGLVDIENGSGAPLRLGVDGGPTTVTLEPGARSRLAITDVEVVRVDADRRAPAWLLGQPHDHLTVTDALGRFALDGVPAGSYELVIWYPPLVRTIDGGRPAWTEPTTLRRRITVGATGTARLALALDPAP